MKNEIFQNPIIKQAADPLIYKHSDGFYYFTASVPAYDRIEIRRAESIPSLREAAPVTVWRKHDKGQMSNLIWAPELHFIEGKWYIYFAATDTPEIIDGLFCHRIFVLENDSKNPLEGTWTEKGQLKTNWESFCLDATTFRHHGTQYLVWAQKDPNIFGNSNLYLARMQNPWTIEGNQIMISRPSFDWETIGFWVNEGPAVLQKNGQIFISYSASATDHNYCMGLLTADAASDLLNPMSWSKSDTPVFSTNYTDGIYGPGHNSFTVSEDGTEDLLVYHARDYKEIDGDPLNDPNRHTRVQKLKWKPDGTPDFQKPTN